MGIVIHEEPELDRPVLIASWPGIGNIGIIAVNYLIQMTEARELAEIEPWDFFEPRKVVIEDGLLKDLEFPSSKFRSEEHTSELQSHSFSSYAVFCLKKKNPHPPPPPH